MIRYPVSHDRRSTFPFNSSFCNFFQRRKEHGAKRDRVSWAGKGDNEERRGVGDPRGVKARVWVWRVPRRPSPHQHMVRFMSIPWMHLVWPSFSASFCIYPLFVSASPLASSRFSFTPSSCSTTTSPHLSRALPGEQGSVPVDLDNEWRGGSVPVDLNSA